MSEFPGIIVSLPTEAPFLGARLLAVLSTPPRSPTDRGWQQVESALLRCG